MNDCYEKKEIYINHDEILFQLVKDTKSFFLLKNFYVKWFEIIFFIKNWININNNNIMYHKNIISIKKTLKNME